MWIKTNAKGRQVQHTSWKRQKLYGQKRRPKSCLLLYASCKHTSVMQLRHAPQRGVRAFQGDSSVSGDTWSQIGSDSIPPYWHPVHWRVLCPFESHTRHELSNSLIINYRAHKRIHIAIRLSRWLFCNVPASCWATAVPIGCRFTYHWFKSNRTSCITLSYHFVTSSPTATGGRLLVRIMMRGNKWDWSHFMWYQAGMWSNQLWTQG